MESITMPSYLIGLDLGKKNDFTALAVLRQTGVPTGTRERRLVGFSLVAGAIYDTVPATESRYDLIHLDRWRDRSYRDVVPEVQRVEAQLSQAAHQDMFERTGVGRHIKPGISLLVDQTGVGQAVVDDLRANGLDCVGITIHGGDAVSRDGQDYRVPKRELVAQMQVLLQARRLGIPDADTMPLAGVLVAELDNFRAKITLSTGHDTYGAGADWREENHDDLVLALAMAAWFGEYGSGNDSELDDYARQLFG